ncbi:MAG: hypothetical protein LBK03_04105 [Bacteroidales bacterium]|nr:hypothetical protein [Bacteroidales bacterium]
MISNSQFSNMLDSIIQFESQNCSSYSTDRNYFIAKSTIDSIRMTEKIVVASINTNALDISFGVFKQNEHDIFVHQSMSDFFNQTKTKVSYSKHIKKDNFVEVYTFDDSQTRWEFLLRDGNISFEWMDGECKNVFEINKYKIFDFFSQKHISFPIDIIEEEVDW